MKRDVVSLRKLVSAMLLIVALIHLLPSSGALGVEKLTALYGLSFDEPNLEILMRHRAVLFGLLGLFFAFAAFESRFHTVALIVGFVSVVSFLLFAWTGEGHNAQIGRVIGADIIALVCLVVGGIAHGYDQRMR